MESNIQPCSKLYIQLLRKPYVNRVSLTRQNLYSKYCKYLEQNICKQMLQDLSKEVLWISVCQRASKLPAAKGGGWTKNTAARSKSE